MNKTEARYAAILEGKRLAGDIVAWRYEEWRVRIGPVHERCWYTPDFWVLTADGHVEHHEVKGGLIRDDARVKFLAAAKGYPWYRWVLARWQKRQWHIESYGGEEAAP
jgi:hypothetical protein